MIYYTIIFVLFILSLFTSKSTKAIKKEKYVGLSVLVYIFFVVFGGFRYEVGADWSPYMYFYNNVKSLSAVFEVREEKLFGLTELLAQQLKLSYPLFVALFFMVSFHIKYKAIKNYTPDLFLSLLIYFYTVFIIYDINGIRQGMALGITLYSIKYIEARKLKYFLLLILVAIGFHYSSIFFLPAYWLYNYKLTTSKAVIGIVVVILIAIPLRLLLQEEVLGLLAKSENFNRYSVYTEDNYNVTSSVVSMGTIQRLVIYFTYIIVLRTSSKLPSRFENFLGNSYFVGIIIFIMFSFTMEYAARLSFCYKFLEVLMVPIAIKKVTKTNSVPIYFIVLAIAFISIYNLLNLPEHGYLLPYKNSIPYLFGL